MRINTALPSALVAVSLWARIAHSRPHDKTTASPTPEATPAAAAESSQVKPTAERSLGDDVPVSTRPVGTKSKPTTATTSDKVPEFQGAKVPDALRENLKERIRVRIDGDLARVKSYRGEAVGLLTEFVNEGSKDPVEMPEAMMRLGELKWEIEREGFIERFQAWEKRPVEQRGNAPEPNYVPSRDLFGRVLKEFRGCKDYDLALYIDGFLATEQGQGDDALDRFDRILREYPGSRFVPDAHMARAENFFGSKFDYANALTEYEEVLRYRESDLRGLALFKSAWCLWRLGNNDEAAKRFLSVFDVAGPNGKPVDANQRRALDELQGEALKYLVQVFTESDQTSASDVHRFLQRVGGDRFAGKILKSLAEQFYDQAHYEQGIEAYEMLLKLDPTNRDAGRWMLQIAAGYNAIEDYKKLAITYNRTLGGYTKGGPWSRTQADPANIAETNVLIETQLREQAVTLHAKAQHDNSSRPEFEGAAGLYAAYLTRFGSQPKGYEMYYHLAEIQFHHLDQNVPAATNYMSAARAIPDSEARPGTPLGMMRHDAIYNAIASLERARVAELEARKGSGAQEAQETETDKKFAEALDLYAQLYPNDPALPELFFRQGKLYYDYGVYDPAVKLWGALLEKYPRSPFAVGAGELILDSFNRAKNYDNIETWARRLKAVPAFRSPTQQARLDTLIVQAVFKQGEQKGAANDHAGAAAAYMRAAQEFPRDARAGQACVNAALEAQKAGDLTILKRAGQLATGKEYRDKPEAAQGAWITATTLQSMGLFADAADFDEELATTSVRNTKFEHTKDAAFNAVLLREATGEHDLAVANGNKFLTAYAREPEADEVVFQMGKAHQNAGRFQQAADLYKRYVTRSKNLDHRVQSYVLLATAELKMGDGTSADVALRDAVKIGKARSRELSADGKYAAAHARYMEGERVLAKFDQIQIQGDVKQLSLRLKQKAELLKQASTVFLDTISLGVAEWSTAALYQIGHTYESFAKSLRDAPPPATLSEKDKESYSQQIEEFAVPIEERSLDAYENGWKKALDLGIYNQWTAKMREALGRLNGELYPPLHETGFEVRSQGSTAFPPLIEAPQRAAIATPGATQ